MKDLGWRVEEESLVMVELVTKIKNSGGGTSLVVQWLRLHIPHAGSQFQSLVWELNPTCQQLKNPHAVTKTWCSQINSKQSNF